MDAFSIIVRAMWDAEARVWGAESPDLPRLIVKAPSQEALIDKLDAVIPEVIEGSPPATALKSGKLPRLISMKSRA